MEKLTFGSLLDVIGELFSDEISIAVSDTEQYIYYRPSKRVDLKIQAVAYGIGRKRHDAAGGRAIGVKSDNRM